MPPWWSAPAGGFDGNSAGLMATNASYGDGHQTAVEDVNRLHYEPEELAAFEGIESEWPLFLAFELVTACCERRWEEARRLHSQLKTLAVEQDGERLYPDCLLYTSPSPRDQRGSRMPSSA